MYQTSHSRPSVNIILRGCKGIRIMNPSCYTVMSNFGKNANKNYTSVLYEGSLSVGQESDIIESYFLMSNMTASSLCRGVEL